MAPLSSAEACAFGWFCTVVASVSAAAARSRACGEANVPTSGTNPPMVCRSPPLSIEHTRSLSSSMSSTRASISSASSTSAVLAESAAVMSFMRLISSTMPLSIARTNHSRSASEISRAGSAPASWSVCASDHLRMAFQLLRSAGPSSRAGSVMLLVRSPCRSVARRGM